MALTAKQKYLRSEHGKERTNATQRLWRAENPDKVKHYALKKAFGIGLEEYNEMFANQEGCCAICGKHQSEEKKALAVDHCHITGKIRGLLCINCNSGIGKLNDDIAILEKAIDYLKEYNNA